MKKPTLKKRKKPEDTAPSRITNETVAEHREQILAGGRKFKYPHQYVKHRLVITAVIISVVVLIMAIVAAWASLYRLQNTSDFMYRVTRVVPAPVANVDGQAVRYSDYLMRYRSQERWLSSKGQLGLSSADDRRQLDFYKRQVLTGLEKDMYAEKLANKLHISVSDKDIQAVVDNNRHTATGVISQEVYNASTKDTLGYSPAEYRHIIGQSLLRQKVAYAIDSDAKAIQEQIGRAIVSKKPATSLESIAGQFQKQYTKVSFGASGFVPKSNQDGGLSKQALLLKDGEISSAVKSTTGDGYYFVQRLGTRNDQVSYQYIEVPLTKFENEFAALQKAHRINEYISIPDVKTS